jgi:hypothetical protein
MKKQSAYQKLKEQVAKLKAEKAELNLQFNKYVTGQMDFEKVVYWKSRFKFENGLEEMVWFGDSTQIKNKIT